MGDLLKITWIANAGLKIEYAGKTLLLDAIYEDEGHPFSKVPQPLQKKLFAHEEPFASVDYLLFTHCHPDHFSSEKLGLFLKDASVKGVFYPEIEKRDEKLEQIIWERDIFRITLPQSTNRRIYHIEPNISVCAFSTKHITINMGELSGTIAHECYLLTFGEKQILITADIDYQTETLQWLAGTKLQAVFITPLFFSALENGNYFHGKLNTERYCIYHIPFSDEDPYKIQKMVISTVAKWTDRKETVIPFLNSLQTLIL